MKRNLHAFFLIGLILSISLVAFGETVKLMSGRVITGEIIERTDEYIKIKEDGRVLMIPQKVIDDGTKDKRRLPWNAFKQKQKPPVSIRERLRAIREKENRKTDQAHLTENSSDLKEGAAAESSQSQGTDSNSNEDIGIPTPAYENVGFICRNLKDIVSRCGYVICYQRHPVVEGFVVRHMTKGYRSPDGSRNKCDYEQSLPDAKGEIIECYFTRHQKQMFIESFEGEASPVFSKNTYLQNALEEGICVKRNISASLRLQQDSDQKGPQENR